MKPEVIRKYTVPRWYYTSVVVPNGEELRVDPDAFANNTKYRMKLICMSFGSPNPTPYIGVAPIPPAQHPNWNHNLLVDIGKSGCGDLNLVSGTLTSLCGNLRRVRTMFGDLNLGRSWRLPTPYLLPRDEGLRVSVEYIKPQYQDKTIWIGPTTSGEVTFLAKGYGADGYPIMLAGRHDGFGDENRGDAVLLNSADLFNHGKHEVYITEFLYKEIDTYYDSGQETDEEWFCSDHGFNFAWTVNPTNPTFTQFMPQPRHIPGGLLAPMCRSVDGGSESPLVYFFPPDTWLNPKQAIGVKLGSTQTTDTEVHIALAGELEVK